jgi:hypothetical protein
MDKISAARQKFRKYSSSQTKGPKLFQLADPFSENFPARRQKFRHYSSTEKNIKKIIQLKNNLFQQGEKSLETSSSETKA